MSIAVKIDATGRITRVPPVASGWAVAGRAEERAVGSTGSRPPLLNGLQRSRRQAARIDAANGAELADRLVRVGRAGRVVAAAPRRAPARGSAGRRRIGARTIAGRPRASVERDAFHVKRVLRCALPGSSRIASSRHVRRSAVGCPRARPGRRRRRGRRGRSRALRAAGRRGPRRPRASPA